MTGYGVRSDVRSCTKEEVRLRTDSGAAWPSLVARAIDADYQINAMSGRGLVRNYGGVEPARPMSLLYPRTLPIGTAIWRSSSWHPSVVVVLLYADFATPIRPGERWPDQTALTADYVRAYRRLLTEVRGRSPGATLVLPWPDFTRSEDAAASGLASNTQAAIRAAAVEVGVARIEFPLLPDFVPENTACDYHGSRGDHRQMAAWMISWSKARPELWSRRGPP